MFKNNTFLSRVTKQHDRALAKWIGLLGWPLRQIIHNVCQVMVRSYPVPENPSAHQPVNWPRFIFTRQNVRARIECCWFFLNIIMLQLPPQTQGHWYQGKPHGIVPSFRWVICALWKALSELMVSVSRTSRHVLNSPPHASTEQNVVWLWVCLDRTTFTIYVLIYLYN